MTPQTLDPRGEETRRRLIVAGLELFGRYGFDAVTTRQLADAAEVNQASIPYHFGGKEGVYLAVAEYIADLSARRLGPIVDRARACLASRPERETLEALLLDTTLAVARFVFEPEHRTIWFTFQTREQLHPSAAFECLYKEFAGPLHEVMGEMIGCLAGSAPDAVETILLTHAYLGQIVGFASARATLNRRLGHRGDFALDDAEAVIAAIGRFSRLAIAGMSAESQAGA
jgi:AcrR family transcriptional regulator